MDIKVLSDDCKGLLMQWMEWSTGLYTDRKLDKLWEQSNAMIDKLKQLEEENANT